MGFVALMAVATSVPANALLTAEDVATSVAEASQAELGDGNGLSNQASQSLDSEGSAELTFTRDDYTTSTVEEAAAAMGIRPANTFTNNPNGTIQWPFAVGVTIGDRFGSRDCAGCSSDHHGQDFNPGNGAPIQVIADGVVRHVEDGEGSLGVNVIVDHTINGRLVSSVYAHMHARLGPRRPRGGDQGRHHPRPHRFHGHVHGTAPALRDPTRRRNLGRPARVALRQRRLTSRNPHD